MVVSMFVSISVFYPNVILRYPNYIILPQWYLTPIRVGSPCRVSKSLTVISLSIQCLASC